MVWYKAQYELDVEKERQRKEKLMKKRERKAAKESKVVVKKVSNKVLRRMRISKMEKEARGDMDVDKKKSKKTAEKMDTEE
ncbi:uncharacterized protein PHALS_04304 [Plasmopara halstedii]|uniref:Uncharacterized protein n=1 Tax=Plasmopara halstedii TaxID=4781 RepID=A0A0P1AZY2_PLAHL|nr:uncharacterized protein PHALS_04304 [Plasmopara halstedii]CEG47429.1 hypothetical protein PHALS_04304 [Plasmopara halstedii]|eukprot:XP_024583798.1 hypothetical protein PHALS_04304 [Plasmopara halstedii]